MLYCVAFHFPSRFLLHSYSNPNDATLAEKISTTANGKRKSDFKVVGIRKRLRLKYTKVMLEKFASMEEEVKKEQIKATEKEEKKSVSKEEEKTELK